MIGAFLLAQAVTVQTLPPPYVAPISPADFSCQVTDQAGANYGLRGRFPAYPAGWDPNRGQPVTLDGNGPAELRGVHVAKPFSVGLEYRRYYVVAQIPTGGHFNLMFVLLADDDGVVTIDRFEPDPQTGRGAMRAVATGNCEAVFETGAVGGAAR